MKVTNYKSLEDMVDTALNESKETGNFAIQHKNGNWVSRDFNVGSFSRAAKFATKEDAQKFMDNDGGNWDNYEIVELNEKCNLKESVTNDIIQQAIFDKFGAYMTDAFEELVTDVCDRIGDFADTSDIDSCIDDALIYDDERWTLMRHYQNPDEANYDEAFTRFIEDIYDVCSKIVEADEEDEEENEEEDKESTDESLKNETVIFSPKRNAYVGSATLYTNDGPVVKEVEFREIGDGLYPVDEKNVFEKGLGPMYDGHNAYGKRIYDRYETQEVYDALSESHKCNESNEEEKDETKYCIVGVKDDGSRLYYVDKGIWDASADKAQTWNDQFKARHECAIATKNEKGLKRMFVPVFNGKDLNEKKCLTESDEVNPLADLKKEPVIELDDGTVLGIEYDNGRLFAGSITNSGIIKEYYVDYDAELSLDANLEKLMQVVGNDPQLSSGWMEVASKEVRDSNGDMTDYTWYTNKHGLNIFMFGDKDVTDPDVDYADWETESDTEAQDWFDNYTGFEDDEEDDYDLELTDDDMNAGQWYESFDRFVEHKLNSIPKMTNEALIKEYRMFRRSNHKEDKAIKEALKAELKNRKNA